MKHAQIKKTAALNHYLLGNQSQKMIAELLSVSEKTISKWINEGKWNDQKELHNITNKKLLQENMAQLKKLNEEIAASGGVPTRDHSIAKNSLIKEMKQIGHVPTAEYVNVFTDFIDFLMRTAPEHAQKFAELSMQFIDSKI